MSVIEDLQEAWNAHDPQRVASLYTEDGVREEFVITHALVSGRDAIAEQVGMYLAAVPDANLTFRRVFADADNVTTIEWTYSGTHKGDAAGWPARGETVELPGASVLEVVDGQIRQERVYADFAVLLAGAGLIPGVEPPSSW
jgi:steroid delta-isomerase-like uncharacterized protein